MDVFRWYRIVGSIKWNDKHRINLQDVMAMISDSFNEWKSEYDNVMTSTPI